MKVKHILKLIEGDCNIIDKHCNLIADTALDIPPDVLDLKVSSVYSNKHWTVQNPWTTIETNETLIYFINKILRKIYNKILNKVRNIAQGEDDD